MDVTVITSLYPSPQRSAEGVFAERRWTEMRARGHGVRVVHPRPKAPPFSRGVWGEIAAMPAREERAGIPVERPRYWHLPRRALGNARRFARAALAALDGTGDPDVVVCDYAWPAAAVAPALRRRGVPCVISGRGSDVLEVAGEAGLAEPLATYLAAAGHWCGVSRDLVETLDRLGDAPGRGRLVPNGVDTERFHPRDRTVARRELDLAGGPLVLVVGHLIERKDPSLALEVFRLGAPEDARLAFVGRGPLEGALRDAVRTAGLERHVTFAGEVAPDDLATWYAASNILLLTSRREGRPNVVLEALASGRPVLATDAGGTRELIGGTNMCATTRVPRELGLRLAGLLAAPPHEDELVALVAPYTWAAACEALEACLEEAVSQGARA